MGVDRRAHRNPEFRITIFSAGHKGGYLPPEPDALLQCLNTQTHLLIAIRPKTSTTAKDCGVATCYPFETSRSAASSTFTIPPASTSAWQHYATSLPHSSLTQRHGQHLALPTDTMTMMRSLALTIRPYTFFAADHMAAFTSTEQSYLRLLSRRHLDTVIATPDDSCTNAGITIATKPSP